MHEIDERVADRRRHAAAKRSHASLTVEPADAPQRPADTFSVDLVAAHEHQRLAVLSVRGEIDLGSAPMLREVLAPVLERQTGPVVVDLSEVEFMDSTGIHVLVDTRLRLTPQNRALAIVCHEGGQVHRLLAVAGLLDLLTVHRSRESAVNGGDAVLRSEPGSNHWPAKDLAPTQGPAYTGPANDQARQAS